MADRPQSLAHLEFLGDATGFAAQMHALIPKCALLENFSPAEVRLLAHFMDVYRAEPGAEIIHEGEGADARRGARPGGPGANHRRAADARRQDPDGAGADAVAAPARDQPAADGISRRAGAARDRYALSAPHPE